MRKSINQSICNIIKKIKQISYNEIIWRKKKHHQTPFYSIWPTGSVGHPHYYYQCEKKMYTIQCNGGGVASMLNHLMLVLYTSIVSNVIFFRGGSWLQQNHQSMLDKVTPIEYFFPSSACCFLSWKSELCSMFFKHTHTHTHLLCINKIHSIWFYLNKNPRFI